MPLDRRRLARMHAPDVEHPVIGLGHAAPQFFLSSFTALFDARQHRSNSNGPHRVCDEFEKCLGRFATAGDGETRDPFHGRRPDDEFAGNRTAVWIGRALRR